jgi:hypothetical protein
MAAPDAATMRKLQAQGKAIKNAKGEPSFQIRNRTDLDHAIKAIGRVRPNTDEARARVRKYVMARAKALGLSSMVPDTWGSDGNLTSGSDDSGSDSSKSSGSGSSSSSSSGSSSPASSGSGSSSSSGSSSIPDDDDSAIAAETKKLIAKGMNPKVARIFAARSQSKKKAA